MSEKDVNPSDTNDIVGEYANASVADAAQALAAARSAFPAWSHTTAQVRADVLARAGIELMAERVDVARASDPFVDKRFVDVRYEDLVGAPMDVVPPQARSAAGFASTIIFSREILNTGYV